MHKLLTIAACIAFLCSCNLSKQSSGNNGLTSQEKNEGWQLLFDGKSTKGWHTYGGEPVGFAWKVKEDLLYLDTSIKENWQIKGGGDIVTDEEYENFELQLEWKIFT